MSCEFKVKASSNPIMFLELHNSSNFFSFYYLLSLICIFVSILLRSQFIVTCMLMLFGIFLTDSHQH